MLSRVGYRGRPGRLEPTLDYAEWHYTSFRSVVNHGFREVNHGFMDPWPSGKALSLGSKGSEFDPP